MSMITGNKFSIGITDIGGFIDRTKTVLSMFYYVGLISE